MRERAARFTAQDVSQEERSASRFVISTPPPSLDKRRRDVCKSQHRDRYTGNLTALYTGEHVFVCSADEDHSPKGFLEDRLEEDLDPVRSSRGGGAAFPRTAGAVLRRRPRSKTSKPRFASFSSDIDDNSFGGADVVNNDPRETEGHKKQLVTRRSRGGPLASRDEDAALPGKGRSTLEDFSEHRLPRSLIFWRACGADTLRIETDDYAVTVSDPQRHTRFFSTSFYDFRVCGHVVDDDTNTKSDFSLRRR